MERAGRRLPAGGRSGGAAGREHGPVRGAQGALPGEPPPGRAGPPRLPAGHPRVPQGRSPALRGRGGGSAAGPGLPGLSEGFHPPAPGAAAGPAAFGSTRRGLHPALPRGRAALSPVGGAPQQEPGRPRGASGRRGAARLPPCRRVELSVTAGGAVCKPPALPVLHRSLGSVEAVSSENTAVTLDGGRGLCCLERGFLNRRGF